MIASPRFKVGDEVCTHSSWRYIPGSHSIIGHVREIRWTAEGFRYRFTANVGGPWSPVGPFPCSGIEVDVLECDLHHRVGGTPLSQLSGRPGHPGYAEFCRIAKSWGHE